MQVVDPHDTHAINKYMRVYGHGIGLDLSDTLRDKTVQIDPIRELMLPVLAPHARYVFWQYAHNTLFDQMNQRKILKDFFSPINNSRNAYQALPAWNWSWAASKAYLRFTFLFSKSYFLNCYLVGFPTATTLAPQKYNVDAITDATVDMIGPHRSITYQEYSDWWKAKIQQIAGDDEAMQDELTLQVFDPFGEGIFFEQKRTVVENEIDDSGQIIGTKTREVKELTLNRGYVQLMLIDLDFFQDDTDLNLFKRAKP